MLQSCETLINKINEWQQAVLELEKLSDEFLNSGDKKIKAEINNKKQEIISYDKEYRISAYHELSNGENLFWPEEELFEELAQTLRKSTEEFIRQNKIEVKDKHIVKINLGGYNLSSFHPMRLSLFKSLEKFWVAHCNFKIFPELSKSIKHVDVSNNSNIKIPEDLSYLDNLERFWANSCNLTILPKFPDSIKDIEVYDNTDIANTEIERIKKEHPNAKIEFDY